MRLILAFAALSIALPPCASAQTAQQPQNSVTLNCTQFRHKPDGQWTPTVPVTVGSPIQSNSPLALGAGTRIWPGKPLNGVDLGGLLNRQCVGH